MNMPLNMRLIAPIGFMALASAAVAFLLMTNEPKSDRDNELANTESSQQSIKAQLTKTDPNDEAIDHLLRIGIAQDNCKDRYVFDNSIATMFIQLSLKKGFSVQSEEAKSLIEQKGQVIKDELKKNGKPAFCDALYAKIGERNVLTDANYPRFMVKK